VNESDDGQRALVGKKRTGRQDASTHLGAIYGNEYCSDDGDLADDVPNSGFGDMNEHDSVHPLY
jgi:hypothetical protein